jgi:hypothetical protein
LYTHNRPTRPDVGRNEDYDYSTLFLNWSAIFKSTGLEPTCPTASDLVEDYGSQREFRKKRKRKKRPTCTMMD